MRKYYYDEKGYLCNTIGGQYVTIEQIELIEQNKKHLSEFIKRYIAADGLADPDLFKLLDT
jgi:hypothetical protein